MIGVERPNVSVAVLSTADDSVGVWSPVDGSDELVVFLELGRERPASGGLVVDLENVAVWGDSEF